MTLPLAIPPLQTARLTLRSARGSDFPAMLAFDDSPRAAFIASGADQLAVWRGPLSNIGHWALCGHGFHSVDTHTRLHMPPMVSYVDPANTRSAAIARNVGATAELETTMWDHAVPLYRHPAAEIAR